MPQPRILCLASALAVVLLMALLVPRSAVAADGDVTVHGDLQRWHKVVIDLDGPASAETADPNPFMDYRYQVRLEGPSGQVLDVPGFFAGDGAGGASGDTWRAYFSPDETGTWTYTIGFREGDEVAVATTATAGTANPSFDGAMGSFEVSASDKSAPDFRASGRGTLVNRGGHFLTFADGTPFYYTGPGIPENLLGYRGFDNTEIGVGHEFTIHEQHFESGDPTWTDAEGETGDALIGALNYIAEQGGNTLYFLPMNLGGDGKDTFPMTAPDQPRRYDLSKLAQWEIAFEHAQSLGLFFNVILAETESANEYFWDDGARSLGPERKLYYRMVNALMGHHNGLKYVVSEETSYDFDLRNTFMAYLKEPSINPYDHPVTFHTGFETNPDSYFEHVGNPDLDTTATQASFNDERMFRYAEKIREETTNSAQPLVAHFDEPQKIENDNDDFADGYPHGRRNKMWPFLMGGGSGFSWYVQKDGGGHGFDQRIEDFTIMENALNWSAHARAFFEALPARQMTTSEVLASSDSGGPTFAFYQPGEIYALYNPDNGGPLELDLSGTSATFAVRWYDPRSGTYATGGVTEVQGGAMRSLGSAPRDTDKDWAVLVERTDGSGNTFPSVSITMPADGASFDAPADLGVTADATDPDGSVTGVELLLDGSAVRTEDGAPYQWGTANSAADDPALLDLASGTYTLTVVATDDAGASAQDSVTVTVTDPNSGNAAPSVSFQQPGDGDTFTAPADLGVVVAASDGDGSVSGVELFLDGGLVRTENVEPYEWGTARSPADAELVDLAAGEYTLEAVATDDDGATASATITVTVAAPDAGNSPPTVSFAMPADGASLTAPADLGVTANASDADGSIAGIDLLLDGAFVRGEDVAPYEWGTAHPSLDDGALLDLPEGDYMLELVATDDDGATASATITVSVTAPGGGGGGNSAPSVSFTTPADGASFTAPADLGVTANASDPDGAVAEVELRLDGTPVRADTDAPFAWGTAAAAADDALLGLPAGDYTLELVATDGEGAMATMSIMVTVTAPGSGGGGGGGGSDDDGGGSGGGSGNGGGGGNGGGSSSDTDDGGTGALGPLLALALLLLAARHRTLARVHVARDRAMIG